jgi:hypothetical protein
MRARRFVRRRLAPAVVPAAFLPASARSEEKPSGLTVGDPAPVLEALADDGKLWKSADPVGKKTVVVCFYSAATTGGCTKQACSFRDNRAQLDKFGAGAVARAFGVPLGEGGTVALPC